MEFADDDEAVVACELEFPLVLLGWTVIGISFVVEFGFVPVKFTAV